MRCGIVTSWTRLVRAVQRVIGQAGRKMDVTTMGDYL